jgi:hypothetical protein
VNVLPDKQNLPFLGISGPQHALPVASATPFEYFCLFIPIFYWDRWATYTNEKADIEMNKTPGKGRKWEYTSAAELKAWVASVIWWCLGATQSMDCFWADNYERSRIKQWFRLICLTNIAAMFRLSCALENFGTQCFGLS